MAFEKVFLDKLYRESFMIDIYKSSKLNEKYIEKLTPKGQEAATIMNGLLWEFIYSHEQFFIDKQKELFDSMGMMQSIGVNDNPFNAYITREIAEGPNRSLQVTYVLYEHGETEPISSKSYIF